MKQKVLSLAISIAMILSIVPFLSVESGALSNDATPPTLTKVEATSQTVKPGESFTITIYANDPSGIDVDRCYVYIARERADGESFINQSAYLVDDGNGKYSATYTVTDDWEVGNYSIDYIRMRDKLGNGYSYYNDDYSDPDNIIPASIFKVSTETNDATPPTLTKVEATSQTVKPGESFTITIYANDPSGIDVDRCYVYIARERADGESFINQSAYLVDDGNGKYSATYTVTDDWISGNYSIDYIRMRDKLGNGYSYYNDDYSDPDNIIPASIFKVSTETNDATPPTLTKVEASSQTVKPGESFTITIYANDPSGIDVDRCYVYIARERADGESFINQSAYLIDDGNGKYSATYMVTDDWISGNYSIDYIRMRDKLGNGYSYYNDDYSDPDNIIPASIFIVVNDDTVKPSESPKPSETVKPSESPKPSETIKPSESPKPSETVKPSESPKPSETVKPSESPKPSETVKPSESPKPSETVKPSESPKPSETVKPSESPKPVDPVIPGDHSDNCPSKPYSDMKNTEGKWFHEGVDYAISKGYMTGVENNLFAPNRAVSRAMVAQILYAAEGKPAVTKSAGFSDVKAGKWYTDAVNWAASKGVVAGYPDGSFKPDKAVTREELVTILYKYAQTKTDAFGIAMDVLDKFQDKDQIHAYAVNAMEWAVTNKIISGTDQGLEPRGTATRAQLAVMLQAFDQVIEK